MGFTGGNLDTPTVLVGQSGVGRGRRSEWGESRASGGSGWTWLTPNSHSSSEWPREPQVPVYVPRFHNGWEPPLDVLQEAPWEVEGLAAASSDEVRALTAHPTGHQRAPPWPPTAFTVSTVCSPILAWPPPHTKLRWPTFPTADSSKPSILSKLPEAQPCI